MGRHPANDRVVLRYGLHLYQRNSTIWQVFIKLKKRDPIRKSLRTDHLSEARELAWQEYSDAKERLVRNEPLRAVTFKKLTEDYLLTKAGKPSVQYHEDTIERHFKPYFTDIGQLHMRSEGARKTAAKANWSPPSGSV